MSILEKVVGKKARKMLPELITLFFEDGEILVAELRAASKAKDSQRLQHAAHTLKGNSASMGMESLQKLAHDIETLGKQGDTSATMQQKVILLDAEYEKIKAALNNETPTQSP